ncbi:MAG TPA: OsmC family protein [Novosphingobium sp.]|nr:OsmC family protein [Novosphingobium sp.]
MANHTTARIDDAQGSPLAVAIEVAGHHLLGDEPVAQGGANLGPSPFDLLTAALGECTAITLRWYARQQGWPLEHVSVTVEHTRMLAAGETTPHDRFRKSVTLTGPLLTGEQLARLHEVADRCPVHKTLTGDIRIDTVAM